PPCLVHHPLRCLAAARHLQLYPTRRSSDLAFPHQVLNAASFKGTYSFQRFDKWQGNFAFLNIVTPRFAHIINAIVEQIVLNLKRSEEHTLNSSHVSISYAVFCLKTKTCVRR